MNIKKYRQFRATVFLFVASIVGVSIWLDIYLLAVVGVITGMLFMSLVKLKTKVSIDEREQIVRDKAATTTYSIFAPTIALGAFFLILSARKEFLYLEALGIVFAYLTLFLIVLYAISYFFINRRYGGGR